MRLIGLIRAQLKDQVTRELAVWHHVLYPSGGRTDWALSDLVVGIGMVGMLVRIGSGLGATRIAANLSKGHVPLWLGITLGILWGITLIATPIVANSLTRGEARKTGSGGWVFTVVAMTDLAWAALGVWLSQPNSFVFGIVLIFMLAEHGAFLSWQKMFFISLIISLGLAIALGSAIQVLWLVALGLTLAFLGSRLRILSERVELLRAQGEREREEPYRLLEQLGASVIVIDQEARAGRGLLAGTEAVVVLGALEELSGRVRTSLKVAQGEDGLWQGVTRMTLGGTVRWVDWAVTSRVRAGELNQWQWLSAQLHIPTHRVVVVVLFDRTALEAEKVRTRAAIEADGALPLAGALAHEIRNPLAALISSADQMSEEDMGEGERKTLARLVSSQAGRLRRLVVDFLELAQVQQKIVGEHNVLEVVRRCVEQTQELADMEVVIDVEEALGVFDAALVERALGNLLANAGQVANSGGRVRISGRTDGIWYQIGVRDWGPGIKQSDRMAVFQPFVTRRRGGTGLGLAIVERSANALGGFVECATPQGARETGEGIEFTFTFVLRDMGQSAGEHDV